MLEYISRTFGKMKNLKSFVISNIPSELDLYTKYKGSKYYDLIEKKSS